MSSAAASAAVAYPGFGWRELTEWFGITPRQLQWLDERGVVPAQRIGHKRIWDLRGAILVGIAFELRYKHCNHARLMRVMHRLSRESIVPTYILITKRGLVRTAENELAVVHIATREKDPLSVIDTRRIRNRVRI